MVESAFDVVGLSSVLRLRERPAGLGEGGAVLIVGDSRPPPRSPSPGPSLALAARGELGAWLFPKARRLRQGFDRLGVTVPRARRHRARRVAASGCVYAIGDNSWPLPMSCTSAGATASQATAAIVARLTDGEVPATGLTTAPASGGGTRFSRWWTSWYRQTVCGLSKTWAWAFSGQRPGLTARQDHGSQM
ncbi:MULTISPECIES: hypothetical protein [unclassified Streptomyces]|uniref:hypothetical protein n=1 Tax=Streptomyces sp. ST1015 TaxID=1848900 RepID=UPI0013A6D2DD|nr:hypothetical protein A7X85_43900 [Streptomyces sp. ST1015]